MRARGWVAAAMVMVVSGTAGAAPKPMPVDIKSYKDKLQVFQDAKGGTYVVLNYDTERQVFYGTGKILYQQRVVSYTNSGNVGDPARTWSMGTMAGRLSDMHQGTIDRKADGTYRKECDGKDDYVITELTGDKAKAVLDKVQFLTPALMYLPLLLARDDSGVYYYVDKLSKTYGGKGYRVFMGKKGAMKETALTDVANDTAGEVFATKTGDLRLVHETNGQTMPSAQWIKGGKGQALVSLDLDMNSPLIYTDLGIYTFLGTLCDNIAP